MAVKTLLPMIVASHCCLINVGAIKVGDKVRRGVKVKVVVSFRASDLGLGAVFGKVCGVGLFQIHNFTCPKVWLERAASDCSVYTGKGIDVIAPKFSRDWGNVLRAGFSLHPTYNFPGAEKEQNVTAHYFTIR